jgi:YbbR domain-containing protein
MVLFWWREGPNRFLLVRRVWKSFQVVWDWGNLEVGTVESAVAADWDEGGQLSLVLAADSQNNRLLLADARSHQVKIRWEYKLPSAPRTIHLCPDTGNFLVILKEFRGGGN